MPKNILFLRGISDSNLSMQPRDQALSGISGAEVDTAALDDLVFDLSIESSSLQVNNTDIEKYDLVVFHGTAPHYRIAYPAALILKQKNINFINSGITDYAGIDKLSQYARFGGIGVPFPRTIFSNFGNLKVRAQEIFDFPFIVKGVIASQGRKNYLVGNSEDLEQINDDTDYKTGMFVAQQYIDNEYDLRLLFIGDELIVIRRTAAEGSHLNNISAGATGEIVSADAVKPEILKDSLAIRDEFRFEICGIDVLVDTQSGEHFFSEINSQPQLFGGAETEAKIAALERLLGR